MNHMNTQTGDFFRVCFGQQGTCSVKLHLIGHSTFFCIDIGAEFTVISEKIYTKNGSPELKNLDKTLNGPGGDQLGLLMSRSKAQL